MTELTELPSLKQLKKPKNKWLNFDIVFGSVILLILIILSIFANQLALFNPNEADPTNIFIPPSAAHPMGTDNIGRDIWSRFVYGGRVSLAVGLVAMAIGAILGTFIGIIAGFYGGWIDSFLSWFTEVLMAFPGVLLAMTIMSILGTGISNVMIAVGISSIPQFMRMARSSVLKTKEMLYVEAARSLGATDRRILYKHILPNILRPIIVLATLGVGGAILDGASLSFLGLGAQPMTPEWGAMLSSGRGFLKNAWWISAFPGIGIFLAIVSINLIGDGIGDELDPDHLREE